MNSISDLQRQAFRVETRVLYADTDHGGVAYYGSYMRWFEIGRTELLRSVGIVYADLERTDILCPVVELRCNYLKPALYDEILVIATWIDSFRRSSIIFGYEIYRRTDQALIARGFTTNVFINKEFKCIRIPQTVMKALKGVNNHINDA